MLIPHKGHTDTIQVYSVTVMTHVKALQAGHSSQGTSEPITPVYPSLLQHHCNIRHRQPWAADALRTRRESYLRGHIKINALITTNIWSVYQCVQYYYYIKFIFLYINCHEHECCLMTLFDKAWWRVRRPTGIHSIVTLHDECNVVHLQKKPHMNPTQYYNCFKKKIRCSLSISCPTCGISYD